MILVSLWLSVECASSYFDVRRVDVARVVLFGGHQLHAGVVVGQHVLEAVLVGALGHLGDRAIGRRTALRDALVLLQQLAHLHVLLQEFALKQDWRFRLVFSPQYIVSKVFVTENASKLDGILVANNNESKKYLRRL